jgi:hypothetical protein
LCFELFVNNFKKIVCVVLKTPPKKKIQYCYQKQDGEFYYENLVSGSGLITTTSVANTFSFFSIVFILNEDINKQLNYKILKINLYLYYIKMLY